MFMVRVFILTLPYNVCIAQSTGVYREAHSFLSLRGPQGRSNLLCARKGAGSGPASLRGPGRATPPATRARGAPPNSPAWVDPAPLGAAQGRTGGNSRAQTP